MFLPGNMILSGDLETIFREDVCIYFTTISNAAVIKSCNDSELESQIYHLPIYTWDITVNRYFLSTLSHKQNQYFLGTFVNGWMESFPASDEAGF